MKLYNKKTGFDYILYTAVTLFCIFLDQLTKFLAVKLLYRQSVPIIEGVLHLTYHENPGMAFGLLPNQRWIFMTVSTVAIIAIALFLYLGHAPSRLSAISLCLIMAGGIGNMIDRIFLEYVIDFIDFCLINFPIFNGADSFVCVGAGLMALSIILLPSEKKTETK